jgi:hypothetical protein
MINILASYGTTSCLFAHGDGGNEALAYIESPGGFARCMGRRARVC